MAYEQKERRGSLFKNDRKDHDSQPSYRGDCKIGGKDYWISAWVKDGKRGKFFSLSFTEKVDKGQSPDNPDEAPF